MKKIITITIIILLVFSTLFLLTGKKRTDVYLKDFKVSEDGKIMTLKVDVSSSTGYIRKMKRTSGSTNYYYTFYQTFGINSKIGAKDTFEIELDQNVDEIYFYTGDKGYKIVLIKDEVTGNWKKINYTENETLSINLFEKDKIISVAIDTYSQNNNYFKYTDKKTIETLYNIFKDLETKKINTTYNPENPEEMYKIIFYNDENMLLESNNDIFKSTIEVYKKDNKFYAEQLYNGIYEITKEDFNIIKNYTK